MIQDTTTVVWRHMDTTRCLLVMWRKWCLYSTYILDMSTNWRFVGYPTGYFHSANETISYKTVLCLSIYNIMQLYFNSFLELGNLNLVEGSVTFWKITELILRIVSHSSLRNSKQKEHHYRISFNSNVLKYAKKGKSSWWSFLWFTKKEERCLDVWD